MPDTSAPTRPLTARSVLASTLLGTEPPRLPVSFLVRTGQLFGLAEGTVRTALSRMARAGDVETDGTGWYALTGELVQRQHRQRRARLAETGPWSGRWRVAVVGAGARPAEQRAGLRRRMEHRRLAELREGVWLRPDNLWIEPDQVDRRCVWFHATADGLHGDDDATLAAGLWNLDRWALRAVELRKEMHELSGRLDRGDTDALAPGFVVSATVLRHFLADPLLPVELLPPNWPGAALRGDYEHYDRRYRELLRAWTDQPTDGPPDRAATTTVVTRD